MNTQDNVAEAKTEVARSVITNAQNYQEVNLEYRIYRSRDLRKQPTREGRLHCPVLDASRSVFAYGDKSLADTTKKDIKEWSMALGSDMTWAFLLIAYLSGPLKDFPRNLIKGSFEEDQVNNGFITTTKDKINTGILVNGYFDQAQFNSLIANVYPELKGKDLTEELLYTKEFDQVYLKVTDLEKILEHNLSNRIAGGIRKMLGQFVSKFEMKTLLLGIMAQAIKPNDSSAETVDAMLLRDLFDLYKYGWFPAPIEEGFFKAGLLKS